VSDYETARWRGTVDATLDDHERRLEAINGNIAAGVEAVHELAVEVATTRQRVAIYAGLAAGGASIAGSVLVGVTIYALTGA
jgi:hypothetical protein